VRRLRVWVLSALLMGGVVAAASACAVKSYATPAGPGVPFAEAHLLWNDVTERCRATRVFVAEIRVTGWVGSPSQRIAPTLHGALTRTDDIYLEIPAPGGPVVQMAGERGRSTFVLPRDRRALEASTVDIVDALIGLRWSAVDLLNVLTGCVDDAPAEVTGVRYGNGAANDQVAIDVRGGARAYLGRVHGAWQVKAASRDGMLVEYLARDGAYPSEVRVSVAAGQPEDITRLSLLFRLGQVQANIDKPPFTLVVPASYVPMTIADLRALRPLDEGKSAQD